MREKEDVFERERVRERGELCKYIGSWSEAQQWTLA